jgi:hypothetical protein
MKIKKYNYDYIDLWIEKAKELVNLWSDYSIMINSDKGGQDENKKQRYSKGRHSNFFV